jgi:hypothetical protein
MMGVGVIEGGGVHWGEMTYTMYTHTNE